MAKGTEKLIAELVEACRVALDVIDNMTGNDLALGKDEPAGSMLRAAIKRARDFDPNTRVLRLTCKEGVPAGC